MLDRLKAPRGSRKKRTRVGRGEGGGAGRTSGRGGKGQTARTGGNIKPGFEGGQMPLKRRLPKRGFTNIFRTKAEIVNLGSIARAFSAGDTVDSASLKAKGLIKAKGAPIKVLGDGEMTSPMTIRAERFSASALQKIKAAGGKAEVV
jgi:large subunit ribosomal protein L15